MQPASDGHRSVKELPESPDIVSVITTTDALPDVG
jgi:hypothetical protein